MCGTLRTLAVCATPLMLLAIGCAGSSGSGGGGGGSGSVAVTPRYQPSSALGSINGKQLPVSVVVTDGRQYKGEVKSDGREVLAEGDKGRVILQRPAKQAVEEGLTSALQTAGFTIKADAPVVVDATLLDLPVEALQFTNWGLPSERGSTLDALAAVVPGPVRPTSAKAQLNVVIRRRDTRLGFPHSVSQVATNKDTAESVVEQTLNQALSAAVSQAVAESAPDIEIATRTPVTAKEIDDRSGEIQRQQQLIKELTDALAVKDTTLVEDAKALEEMRLRVAQERQRLQAAATTDRQTLEQERAKAEKARLEAEQEKARLVAERKQAATQQQQATQEQQKLANDRAAVEAERKALATKAQELSGQVQTVATAKDDLAKVRAQQQDADRRSAELAQKATELSTKAAELTRQSQELAKQSAAADARALELARQASAVEAGKGDVEARRKALDEREQNLAAYAAKLQAQTASSQAMESDLRQRKQELTDREAALTSWKSDLERRVAVRPPAAIVQAHKPLIVVTDPTLARTETTLPRIAITGVATDDRAIASLRATVNGRPIDLLPPAKGSKGVGVRSRTVAAPAPATGPSAQAGGDTLAAQRFSFDADLHDGSNEIVIEATDDENLQSSEKLTVVQASGVGRVYVITIGVNDYINRNTVPPLQFAVSDAREVAGALEKSMKAPADRRVREILNQDASRENLTDQLFYGLPSEVRPQDTVIIFFSGHGAPDTVTDAKGNVETYLLPIDANPARLFSTAIRMSDVGKMLQRLRSDRIVFLADTCYSGAATAGPGARTVGVPGIALRAVGVRTLPKHPEGKGCAIITASTGTQVAQEREDFKHGVFSYYVLQGLKGGADRNGDGNVTVDELFDYVKTSVEKTSNGSQTPQISRDPMAGEIVLSKVTK